MGLRLLIRVTSLIVTTLFPIWTFAQIVLPEPIISKYAQGNLSIRWEPSSLDEWTAARTNGYIVDILSGSGTLIQSRTVKPYSPEAFQTEISQASIELAPFFDACFGLMHPDRAGSGQDIKSVLDHMVQETEFTVDSFRLSMLSFYSSYSMRLAEAVGLGVHFTDLIPEAAKCNIYVVGYPVRELQVAMFRRPATIPSLVAKWGDLEVRLEWDVKDKYKDYIGYYVERSTDGHKFFKLNPLPFLDPAVGIDGIKQGDIIGIEDSLALNYKDYYYRLKTMDYFGHVSEASALVKGYGYDKVEYSPQIVYADQLEDNKAHIKWEINAKDFNLIKAFQILRSDQSEGTYSPVDTFPNMSREARIPMVYETNYFRVEIIPFDGEPVSSFPVFVMGMDTIPPLTPVVIGAYIDTLGRVSIQWHANTEPDLLGYKVFRSNFASNEYSLQTVNPTKDSVFIDSISLLMGMKNVYYVVQAVDKRNNRSPFTEPIILERLDIVPPGAPVIVKLEQSNDTIRIHWVRSGSDDAILHQLFRRNLDNDEKWKLIAELDSTASLDTIYFDSGLQFDKKYGYTMRAKDNAELLSGMAPMKVLYFQKPEIPFEPGIQLVSTYDPDLKSIQLILACDEMEKVSSVLLYRGWEREKLGKYKFMDTIDSPFSDSIGGKERVFYRAKVSYEGDPKSYYSDVLETVIPK